MQSTTHCRTRDQYIEREINATEKKKPLNIMARRRLMIVVKLSGQSESASVGCRKKNLIKIIIHHWNVAFFSELQSAQQDLALIVFPLWGKPTLKSGSVKNILADPELYFLSGGVSTVYWLRDRHLSIILAESIRKLCGPCPAESLDIVRLHRYSHVAWMMGATSVKVWVRVLDFHPGL